MKYEKIYLKTASVFKDLSTTAPDTVSDSRLVYNTSNHKFISSGAGFDGTALWKIDQYCRCFKFKITKDSSKESSISLTYRLSYYDKDGKSTSKTGKINSGDGDPLEITLDVKSIVYIVSLEIKIGSVTYGYLAVINTFTIDVPPTNVWVEKLPVDSPKVEVNPAALEFNEFYHNESGNITGDAKKKTFTIGGIDLTDIYFKFTANILDPLTSITVKYDSIKTEKIMLDSSTLEAKYSGLLQKVTDIFFITTGGSKVSADWSCEIKGVVKPIEYAGTTKNSYLGEDYKFWFKHICDGSIKLASSDWVDDTDMSDPSKVTFNHLDIKVTSIQRILVYNKTDNTEKYIYYRDPYPELGEEDFIDGKGIKYFSFRNNDEVVFIDSKKPCNYDVFTDMSFEDVEAAIDSDPGLLAYSTEGKVYDISKKEKTDLLVYYLDFGVKK